MDSHVFRLVAGELARLLDGARMEKIHGPAPGVFTFGLFARGAKLRLLLRCERQSPFLFFCSRRLSNPARPPALVMRLRKYCADKRLGRAAIDFASRRIAFPVGGPSSFGGGPASLRGAPPSGGNAGPPGQIDDKPRLASKMPGQGLASPCGAWGRAPLSPVGFDNNGLVGSMGQGTPWLLLDLRTGPEVLFALPPGFGDEPAWPEAALADSLCDRPWNRKEVRGPWQEYAVLTPFLRESLAGMDAMEGRALLVDIEAGGGDLFPYADSSGRLSLYSAWPLPEAVSRRRGLVPWQKAGEPGSAETAARSEASGNPAVGVASTQAVDAPGNPARPEGDAGLPEDFPALRLVSRVDEPRFFADFGGRVEQAERQPLRREARRRDRLLNTLDREEERLRALVGLREDACRLREVLWQYPADARLDSVSLPGDTEGGPPRTIALDPLLTVRENMARMFHASDRGNRGLEHVKRRRAEVLGQVSEAEEGGRDSTGSSVASGVSGHSARPGERVGQEAKAGPRLLPEAAPAAGQRAGQRAGQLAGQMAGQLAGQMAGRKGDESQGIKNVARFLSSDGFTLLRGKNALGNQSLLKLGQPHDLWLHALDGPSAHLIIRLSHAGQEVPESTLREAAALVGEKSWQRHDARARIMVAFLRHVRAIKGAAPGTVRVDSVYRTVTVSLDGSGESPQK